MPDPSKEAQAKREQELKLVDSLLVVNLPYEVDPEKDAAWEDKERAKYTTEDWEREFKLKPVGHKDSYPVFGDWRRQMHERRLAYDSKYAVYRGWDFGKAQPCVEFMQVVEAKWINSIDEIAPANIVLDDLVSRVKIHSAQMYPGAVFHDWVDATGVAEKDDGRSSIKVMRDHGLQPRWRSGMEIEDGIMVMQRHLIALVEGRPRWSIDPDKCPKLVEAVRGGYKRDKRGKIMKDGTHDHPVDAARYSHMGIHAVFDKKLQDQYEKARQYRYKPRYESEMVKR